MQGAIRREQRKDSDGEEVKGQEPHEHGREDGDDERDFGGAHGLSLGDVVGGEFGFGGGCGADEGDGGEADGADGDEHLGADGGVGEAGAAEVVEVFAVDEEGDEEAVALHGKAADDDGHGLGGGFILREDGGDGAREHGGEEGEEADEGEVFLQAHL